MKRSFLQLTIFLAGCSCYGQNVNQFTGTLNYSYPLLHLPSERGDGVSIDAFYNAGIRVNQPASEIGLGWSLNTGGTIYRTVSGFPDDMLNYSDVDLITGLTTNGQGALYPAANGTATNFDLTSTNKGPALDSVEFILPAFDNFQVEAPAFRGQMKLNYHRFYGYSKLNTYGTSPPQLSVRSAASLRRSRIQETAIPLCSRFCRHADITSLPRNSNGYYSLQYSCLITYRSRLHKQCRTFYRDASKWCFDYKSKF